MLENFVHLYCGRFGRGKPNFVLASVCGAAATLALPVAGTLSVLFEGAALLPGGGSDDAPVRAAAILLMTVLPVMLLFVFAGMLALSILLWLSKWFAKGTIFLGVLFESLLIGGGFAFLSANQFGPADAWITFALFGGVIFVSLGTGSALWWVLLHRSGKVRTWPLPELLAQMRAALRADRTPSRRQPIHGQRNSLMILAVPVDH